MATTRSAQLRHGILSSVHGIISSRAWSISWRLSSFHSHRMLAVCEARGADTNGYNYGFSRMDIASIPRSSVIHIHRELYLSHYSQMQRLRLPTTHYLAQCVYAILGLRLRIPPRHRDNLKACTYTNGVYISLPVGVISIMVAGRRVAFRVTRRTILHPRIDRCWRTRARARERLESRVSRNSFAHSLRELQRGRGNGILWHRRVA